MANITRQELAQQIFEAVSSNEALCKAFMSVEDA